MDQLTTFQEDMVEMDLKHKAEIAKGQLKSEWIYEGIDFPK